MRHNWAHSSDPGGEVQRRVCGRRAFLFQNVPQSECEQKRNPLPPNSLEVRMARSRSPDPTSRGRARSGEIRGARSRSSDLPIKFREVQLRVIPYRIWIWSFGAEFVKHARGAPDELSASDVPRARSRHPGPTSRDRERSGEAWRARSRSFDIPTHFHASHVPVIPCQI